MIMRYKLACIHVIYDFGTCKCHLLCNIYIYILAKKRVLMYYPLQGVSMFFLIKMVHPV